MSAVVGVMGLGDMGPALAERLIDTGGHVIGLDPSAAARERAREAGVGLVDDGAALLARAPVVLSSLPNGDVVRRAWVAEGGLLDQAPDGAVWRRDEDAGGTS